METKKGLSEVRKKTKEEIIGYTHTKRFKVLMSFVLMFLVSWIFFRISVKREAAELVKVMEANKAGLEPDYSKVSGTVLWFFGMMISALGVCGSIIYQMLRTTKKAVIDTTISDFRNLYNEYQKSVYGLEKNVR